MERIGIVMDGGKAQLFAGVFMGVCLLVIAAILLDLWDGVQTARRTGERVHSHKLRVTMAKVSEYWRFVTVGFLVDCLGLLFEFYGLPFVALVFGAGLIGVEAKSMFEHAGRRKSHVRELPELVRAIIECAHEKDALRLLEELGPSRAGNQPEDSGGQPADLSRAGNCRRARKPTRGWLKAEI